MTKHLPYAEAKVIFDKILAIDVDKVPVVSTERLYHKELASQLRKLLRELGINSRMVSVTAPNYSMAMSIDVKVPQIATEISYAEYNALSQEELTAYTNTRIDHENHRDDATKHLRDVIDAAFPNCDDRSHYMTDYYDYKYSCY